MWDVKEPTHYSKRVEHEVPGVVAVLCERMGGTEKVICLAWDFMSRSPVTLHLGAEVAITKKKHFLQLSVKKVIKSSCSINFLSWHCLPKQWVQLIYECGLYMSIYSKGFLTTASQCGVWVPSICTTIINSYSSRTRRIWADIYNQRGRRPSWLLSCLLYTSPSPRDA